MAKEHVSEWVTSVEQSFQMGLEQGRVEKQESIIKLLEDEIQRLIDIAGQREGGPAWRSAGIKNCEHLIALIKGENK